MKKFKIKVSWILLTLVMMLSFSSLLIACSQKSNNNVKDNLKIVNKETAYDANEIKRLNNNLEKITDTSSSVSKALILNKEKNLNSITLLTEYFNSVNKKNLTDFFDRDFVNNLNLSKLFANKNLQEQFIINNTSANDPFKQLNAKKNVLMIKRLFLLFFNSMFFQKDILDLNDNVIYDFFESDINKTFNDYQSSDYGKIQIILQKKLEEYNSLVKNQNYSILLDWSRDNLQRLFLEIGQKKTISNDMTAKEIDKQYRGMMKNFFSVRFSFSGLKPVINDEIKQNFVEGFKDLNNQGQLIVFSLPFISYLVEIIDELPLKDARAEWADDDAIPKNITGTINKKLFQKYLSSQFNLNKIVDTVNKIFTIDDNSELIFRKLVVIICLTPQMKSLVKSFELDLTLTGFELIKYLALNIYKGFWGIGTKHHIFNDFFAGIKPQLIDLSSDLKKNYLNYIPALNLDINNSIIIMEDFIKNLNSLTTEANIKKLQHKNNGIENLKKILEPSSQTIEALATINSSIKMTLEAGLIALKAILLKQNDENHANIKEILKINMNTDHVWKIMNKKLNFLDKKIIVSYEMIFSFEASSIKKYYFEYEFQGLKDKLKLAKFEAR